VNYLGVSFLPPPSRRGENARNLAGLQDCRAKLRLRGVFLLAHLATFGRLTVEHFLLAISLYVMVTCGRPHSAAAFVEEDADL